MKTKQEILFDVILEKLSTSPVGILVKDVDGVDPLQVVVDLQSSISSPLYASIVGYSATIPTNPNNISDKIEDVVKWRSEPDKTGHIICFILGETDKLHSLAEFDIVYTRDLTHRLICSCEDRNAPEKAFWAALDSMSSHYHYDVVAEFVSSIDGNVSTTVIGENLWRLGLLCDKNILNKDIKPSERLQLNSNLIIAMGQMSEESRKKIANSLARSIKDKNQVLIDSYKTLDKFYKYGKKETLKDLDYTNVQLLFSYSSKKTTPSTSSPVKPTDPNAPLKAKDVSKIISDIVVDQNDEALSHLKDLYEGLSKHFEDSTDSATEISVTNETFNNRPIQIEKVNSQFRKIIGATCNKDSWGGVLCTKEPVLRDALYSEYEDFKPMSPISKESSITFGGSPLFEYIKNFNSILLKEGSDHIQDFNPIISALTDSRKVLVSKLDMIMYYPVLSFATDDALYNSLVNYVSSWQELLHAFCNNENEMHGKSSDATVWIARTLLMLDVLYVKTPTEWKAVLLPTHPLHLWKYYEIFKSLRHEKDHISDDDAKELSRVINSLPQMLNFVVVDKLITSSDHSVELPCSGTVEMLPSYENKTNRYLGNDGIECVAEYISRWVEFAPYSKSEVRICTVDAPDLPKILKDLKDVIQNGICQRLSYTVYLTRQQNGNNELSKLDYASEDFEIGELIKNNQLVLNIINVSSPNDVKSFLENDPVHLAFYFDQLTYTIDHGPTTKCLYISPLVVSYDYKYDEVNKRGQIFPSSDMDSGMIGDYHKMLKFAGLVAADHVPMPTYDQNADISSILSTIQDKNTQWLIAADRTTNQYLPSNSIPIGEKQYGKRTVTIWADASSRIIQQFISLLKNYNLYPDSTKLVNILSQFGHISSEGLVTIPKNDFQKDAVNNRRKGLIGTIFAAAWYTNQYKDSLIASLDSPDARVWLGNSSMGNERADLIGLRYDDSSHTLILQPIEVKTRDESPDAVISSDSQGNKVITGHAADQVSIVVRMLEELFGIRSQETLDMFISSRKEVLKYQIVSECFRSNYESEWQMKWSRILKDVFSNNPKLSIHVSGMLLHVKMGQLDTKRYMCYNPSFDDCPIDFIELGTKDIQDDILGSCYKQSVSSEATVDFDESSVLSQYKDRFEQLDKFPADLPTVLDNSSSFTVEDGTQTQVCDPGFDTEKAISKSDEPSSPFAVETRTEDLGELSELINDFKKSCRDYSIRLKEVCKPDEVLIGPSIIRISFTLERGQQLSPLANKMEDISREMKRTGIFIQQIPNSDTLVLDVPRKKRDVVKFVDVIDKLPTVDSPEKLFFTLGRTPDGEDIYKDLSELPHLLVAGSTGSGKTVFLFTLLASLLKTHKSPDELKILLSSSGMEDFVHFEGIPHLIGNKIVSDAEEATELIKTTVFQEFEAREKILTDARVSNIIQYNEKFDKKMAPIVVVIDEFADLADQLGTKAEKDAFFTPVKRIAQIGRKRGIHLILCTQRPSATLVPSNIKSQLTGRVALRVNDSNSSRMILEDSGNARFLLNHGDMIYKNSGETQRAQGYFITTEELDAIIEEIKNRQ